MAVVAYTEFWNSQGNYIFDSCLFVLFCFLKFSFTMLIAGKIAQVVNLVWQFYCHRYADF